jgi:hypothetical protein
MPDFRYYIYKKLEIFDQLVGLGEDSDELCVEESFSLRLRARARLVDYYLNGIRKKNSRVNH